MQRRILAAGTVVMAVAILYLLAGAIPQDHGRQTAIFESPAFLAMAAAGGILLLAACFRRRPFPGQIAFMLTHAGLAILMAGAAIDWLDGQRIDGIRLPVGMGHAVGNLRDSDGQTVDLGFTLEVTDFSVAYYDPVYSLFRPDPDAPDGRTFVQKVDPRVPATLRQIPGGGVAVEDLKAQDGWVRELSFGDGWILEKQPEVPRWYEASIRTAIDGVERFEGLAVNHPVVAKGWQVLLVSYGGEPMSYVELAFKRSPGRRLVVGGIWSTLVGVSLLCWIPSGPRRNGHAEP